MEQSRQKLKAALVEKDGQIFRSAQRLALNYNRLSAYLSGRLNPSEDVIKKLEQYLGKGRSELGL